MEKKLYVIYREYTGEGHVAEIAEVNIESETSKQFKIRNKGVYRNTVNKSELDCIVSNGNYLFTYDLEKGSKIWNDYYEAQAEYYRNKMEDAIATII